MTRMTPTATPATPTTGHATRRSGSKRQRSIGSEQAERSQARVAQLAELHERLTTQVEDLASTPAWRAMLETAARFHHYSLNNQLLIGLQAAERGFTPTRVAGFTTWRSLGRRVVKGARGLAVLAPCTYTPSRDHDGPDSPEGRPEPQAQGAHRAQEPPAARRADAGSAREGAAARVLRGFRITYVFDITQTEGEALPKVSPALLTGQAPAALWDALADQVTAHGYALHRGPCRGNANGATDPAARTVTVRADVEDAQAVKTLAHELAHIECGHTEDAHAYLTCRGRAETEAESVAYVVTTWAGLDTGAYSVPYVAAWAGGDAEAVKAAALNVTTAARRILDRLDRFQEVPAPAGAEPTT